MAETRFVGRKLKIFGGLRPHQILLIFWLWPKEVIKNSLALLKDSNAMTSKSIFIQILLEENFFEKIRKFLTFKNLNFQIGLKRAKMP